MVRPSSAMHAVGVLVLALMALCSSPQGVWAITSEKGRSYDFQQFLRNRDCSAWGLGNNPVPEAFKYDQADALNSCTGVINTFYYFKTITFGAYLETSVLLRALKGISEAMWNTWAHYDAKAVDTLGKLKADPGRRQPPSKRTTRNKNIAIAFALTRVSAYLIPPAAKEAAVVLDLLTQGTGLSSATTTTTPNTPAGVGNLVAQELIAALKNDGWNSEGNMSPKNPFPFADYTDYRPINNEYDVTYPTRYQPLVETDQFGYFFQQLHTTPQLRSPKVKTWAVPRSWIDRRKMPGPWSSAPTKLVQGKDWKAYKGNVTGVLKASAGLTESQKLLTEFFDNKVVSFGGFERWYAHKRKWCIDDWVKYDQLSACLYDGTILAWKEKIRIDAIRPASAIRFLRDHGILGPTVRSWGGKAAGYKTTNVDTYKWQSYMRTMPHSEFPSGTSCVCSIWAEWTKLFQGGSDKLDLTLEWKPGCSSVEQGVTPKKTLRYTLKTISQARQICLQSRSWAGVHFEASIKAGDDLCQPVAKMCYAKVQRLSAGNPK